MNEREVQMPGRKEGRKERKEGREERIEGREEKIEWEEKREGSKKDRKTEPVAQGQYVVSDTHCSALHGCKSE